MKRTTMIISHIENGAKIKATGVIENGYFNAEYRYKGMTYGVSLPVSDCEMDKPPAEAIAVLHGEDSENNSLPSDEEIEISGKEGGLRDNELQLYWEGAKWMRSVAEKSKNTENIFTELEKKAEERYPEVEVIDFWDVHTNEQRAEQRQIYLQAIEDFKQLLK